MIVTVQRVWCWIMEKLENRDWAFRAGLYQLAVAHCWCSGMLGVMWETVADLLKLPFLVLRAVILYAILKRRIRHIWYSEG